MMPRSIADSALRASPVSAPSRSRRHVADPVALRWRLAARSGAIGLFAMTICAGLISGGQLDYAGSPWMKIPGQVASLAGLAADDISISGLQRHEPEQVLEAMGIKPGSALIGFDAQGARARLTALDWISEASVMRQYPNRLVVSLTERVPFAIWQQEGSHVVIDQSGLVITSLDPASQPRLLVVTGDGANLAAAELVSALKDAPGLAAVVRGAARVGGRRWTLFLESGTTIALPEKGIPAALQQASVLEEKTLILRKGIAAIDMRIPGRMTIAVALQEAAATTASIRPLKTSH